MRKKFLVSDPFFLFNSNYSNNVIYSTIYVSTSCQNCFVIFMIYLDR